MPFQTLIVFHRDKHGYSSAAPGQLAGSLLFDLMNERRQVLTGLRNREASSRHFLMAIHIATLPVVRPKRQSPLENSGVEG